MTKRSIAFLACGFVALTLALSGCGRKGALEAAPDKDPAYPRQYPAPTTVTAGDSGQVVNDAERTDNADRPYRTYSNYPRPKQSSYPYRK